MSSHYKKDVFPPSFQEEDRLTKVHWGMGRSNVLIVSCVTLVSGFSLVPAEGFKDQLSEPSENVWCPKTGQCFFPKARVEWQVPLWTCRRVSREWQSPNLPRSISYSHLFTSIHKNYFHRSKARADAKQQGLLRASWNVNETWVEIWGNRTWMNKKI